jgi:hypothetical protein
MHDLSETLEVDDLVSGEFAERLLRPGRVTTPERADLYAFAITGCAVRTVL